MIAKFDCIRRPLGEVRDCKLLLSDERLPDGTGKFMEAGALLLEPCQGCGNRFIDPPALSALAVMGKFIEPPACFPLVKTGVLFPRASCCNARVGELEPSPVLRTVWWFKMPDCGSVFESWSTASQRR